MLKRLAPAIVLLLLASACGGTEFDVRARETKGPDWFPQVVEFEKNAGPGLSMTTDADGNPHLAYLELEEAPPPGVAPPPPDPLAPVLPAIGHAHLVDNVWTHTEVAQDRKKLSLIAGSGSKTPALSTGDETAIAVDAEGTHHIAWTEEGHVFYSNDPSGETEPVLVDPVDAKGLSIAADDQGSPWIAYYEILKGAEGPSTLVRVATLQGEKWDIQTAAEADASEPFGSGIGVGPAGPIVAYDGATGTSIARREGTTWRSEIADPDGGLGVSMDLDGDGNPHLAYLTPDGQVRHAHSIGGAPWEVSDVGAAVALATTSIALDDGGTHYIAWQRDVDLAYATNASGEFAEAPLPEATLGGARPRLAAGAGAVYLAWYSPQGTLLNMATYSEDQPLLAVPTPTAAPPGGGAPPACQPDGTELSITAQNLQFDTDCLAAPAGEALSIEFDNQDAGVPHNLGIYTDPSATEELFKGDTVTGVDSTTYQIDAIDQEGTLHFQCDFHPTTMTGTFVVAAA